MRSRGETDRERNGMGGIYKHLAILVVLILTLSLASPVNAQLSDPFAVWGYVKNDAGGADGGRR